MRHVKFDCENGDEFRMSNCSQLLYFLFDLLQFLPSLGGCVILRLKGDNVEFKWRRRNNVIYNRVRCVDYPETSLNREISMKRKREGERERVLPLLG